VPYWAQMRGASSTHQVGSLGTRAGTCCVPESASTSQVPCDKTGSIVPAWGQTDNLPRLSTVMSPMPIAALTGDDVADTLSLFPTTFPGTFRA
jgi:hypothetical protein